MSHCGHKQSVVVASQFAERLVALAYFITRYRLDNLIHVARNPSVARTDEPELLVCDLR